jgi:hypothetical protein
MKVLLLVLFMIAFVYGNVSGQEIGALFISSDHFLTGHHYPFGISTFKMNDRGVAIGFMLPINIPILDSHYKVRAMFRGGIDTTSGVDQDYIALTNEFLLGKRLKFGQSQWDVLPQIGLGSTIEDIYAKWGEGFVYYVLFVDLATTLNYQFDKFGLGLMINLESAVYTQYVEADTDYRLGVSLLIWK